MLFNVKRVKGSGSNPIKTINVELPLGVIDKGVWSAKIFIGNGWSRKSYKSVASVSEYRGCLCIEIHAIDSNINVDINEPLKLFFLKKVRDKIFITDPVLQLQSDIELVKSTTLINCENCERYYSRDYGYSNYTVEGTSYGCYADVFSESDDDNIVSNYANSCGLYLEGDMWSFDVESNSDDEPSAEWMAATKRDVTLSKVLKGE